MTPLDCWAAGCYTQKSRRRAERVGVGPPTQVRKKKRGANQDLRQNHSHTSDGHPLAQQLQAVTQLLQFCSTLRLLQACSLTKQVPFNDLRHNGYSRTILGISSGTPLPSPCLPRPALPTHLAPQSHPDMLSQPLPQLPPPRFSFEPLKRSSPLYSSVLLDESPIPAPTVVDY
jgi:hypothetical protein